MAKSAKDGDDDFTVPFRDIDLNGEMHRAAYIIHAEDALARFWLRRGSVAGDPAFRVSKVGCTIHSPLKLGQVVNRDVRVSKIGGRSAGFSVLFTVGDHLAAEAEIVWTSISPDSGDTVPLSEELRDWLYQYLD
ncbi:acyl-CoA thioesterase [Rhizobium oryzicola]|uniref:Acyl-CoA thioesterase n=1 Tax=Rhizobium oryzicola TaxID=1232668 RepID=A0ABT8SS95_9HYPH|nr:thioesterase family protein [Rhizobium oryzicola]MDO1581277.1 acyl-CoA thioesterase [Rhizobium oryzicola]